MKNATVDYSNRNENQDLACFGAGALSSHCRSELANVKQQLVKQLSSEFPEVDARMVRQAVTEADALASLTSVPLLLLPSLAEEKVAGLHHWTQHQRMLAGQGSIALAA